eukprot:gene10454-19164_t
MEGVHGIFATVLWVLTKVEGPVEPFDMDEVTKALARMKNAWKAKPITVETANGILYRDDMPQEWMLSTLVLIFKNKGSVIERGFMPGKGTVGVVYIVRTMQEVTLRGKRMSTCVCGLGERFDRVPRKVIEWCTRVQK